MNNKVLRQLSYGVYAVSTLDNNRPTGCIANSIMQITSSPATVAVSINHNNYTNKCIKDKKKFSVSILSEKTSQELIGKFGFRSGKDINKFEGVDYSIKSEMPVLNESCGYIVCKVVNTMETDTHTIFLGEILDGDELQNNNPMTYAYYHNVVKGKSPKAAPTYIEENIEKESKDSIKEKKYVCSVCGYVYDGDIPFENLPDDYCCPICKQPKSVFHVVEK